MSDARKFKFVSPGIFLNEIDQSQIPALPENVGPVIIGRTERGPGMVPTKVNSFSEFVEKFGNPVAGRGGGLDVWRDGNYASPTYASYAAQAYLRAGVGPVTMVRLMGTQSPDASSGGYAGWTTANTPDGTLADNGGAYGLYVWNSGSSVAATATLTMADGDLTTENQFTEGEYVIVTSTNGTKFVYVLTDGSESGASATGTVLTEGSDLGAGTLPAATAALGTCVAVNNNLNTHSQSLVLNEIKAAIVHANGHNGKIACSADVSVADGAQTITLTQDIAGEPGNTTVTTNISQLTVADFTGGVSDTGTLAAVWYIDNGGAVGLSGSLGTNASDTPTQHSGAATVVESDSSGQFKAIIYNSSAGVEENITFSLAESSDNFIRKVFNTNPQLTNTAIETSANTKSYWLGETYDRYLVDQGRTAAAIQYGAIMAVASGSGENGSHEKRMPFRDAHTGWFFGQSLSAATGSYEYDAQQKLFKFVGINGHGEWLQNNIKISINNIRASSNENVPYGTFDVLLRRADDSDLKPVILERYSGCTLDPGSQNYIAVKIGDTSLVWDETEKRYRDFGNYPNRSDYVRVVMNDAVDNGGAEPSLLPFGVYGPPRYNTFSVFSGSAAAERPHHITNLAYAMGGDTGIPQVPQQIGTAAAIYTNLDFGTASIAFPTVATRVSCSSTTNADGTDPTKNAYFGLQTGKTATSAVFDPGYGDYLRTFGADIIADASWVDTYGDSGYSGLTYQWVFSLDEVAVTTGTSWSSSTPATNITEAYWQSGSHKASTAWNASSSLGLSRYQNILDAKINRFTSPLWGGFDGLDITERDPFRNSTIESGTETTNYAYYSIRRAIDTVADAEVVAMNAASVPGLTNENLTKYLIDTCEERADALAVIDLKGGFTPRADDTSTNKTASDRKGVLDTVISNIKARNLNSSYGCAYYPWVSIRDDINGAFLKVPPSIVALGVMANTERAADVWFAPAGFNRGGLSNGAGGLPVVGVEEKLTSRNRDDLYEVNINPIASFPAEGIVVFGQKTLQATQSALDRINVRRLMIFVKRGISRIASTTLFQPNVAATWSSFKSKADNFLSDVKVRFGVDDFRVVLDETTTTADLIDRNIMYAKIFVKPTRAIEFIAIDFIITRSGASFED